MNFYDYLKESSLSRIFKHTVTKENVYGIITAFRGGDEYTRSENLARNYQLINKIRDAKYGFFMVYGSYIENQGKPDERKVKEDSIFINGGKNDNGRLKGLLKKWMKEYEQDSVLYKADGGDTAYLLTNKGETISVGKFHPNKISDFMTELKGKKGKFVFEGVATSMGFFERWLKDTREKNEKLGIEPIQEDN